MRTQKKMKRNKNEKQQMHHFKDITTYIPIRVMKIARIFHLTPTIELP